MITQLSCSTEFSSRSDLGSEKSYGGGVAVHSSQYSGVHSTPQYAGAVPVTARRDLRPSTTFTQVMTTAFCVQFWASNSFILKDLLESIML